MIPHRAHRSRCVLGAVIVVAVMSIAADSARADVTIILREEHPIEGGEAEISIQDDTGTGIADAEVRVTYRPGSSVEKTETVGVTNESGRIMWTPSMAGIATIDASWGEEAASLNVSIRFSSVPVLGVIIMILAGLLLVGGSVIRIGRVLRATE